jgi:hypothetical protein
MESNMKENPRSTVVSFELTASSIRSPVLSCHVVFGVQMSPEG